MSEIPEAGVLSGVVRRSGEHQCCGSACYPPPAGFRLADSGREVHTPSGGPPSYVTEREGEGPHRTAQVPDGFVGIMRRIQRPGNSSLLCTVGTLKSCVCMVQLPQTRCRKMCLDFAASIPCHD